jgi:uncharacterized protein (TIGR00251 family)
MKTSAATWITIDLLLIGSLIFVSLINALSSLRQDGADVVIRILVHAGAKRDAIVKEHDQSLRVDIKAPPERGAANDALIRFFAKLFSKPVSDVEVRHGHISRNKVLVVRNCLCSDIVPIVMHNLRSTTKS